MDIRSALNSALPVFFADTPFEQTIARAFILSVVASLLMALGYIIAVKALQFSLSAKWLGAMMLLHLPVAQTMNSEFMRAQNEYPHSKAGSRLKTNLCGLIGGWVAIYIVMSLSGSDPQTVQLVPAVVVLSYAASLWNILVIDALLYVKVIGKYSTAASMVGLAAACLWVFLENN